MPPPPIWRRAAWPSTLFEAAGQAGGRCRSYFDPDFEGVIDNGNHLVLSGNHAIYQYLNRIGAAQHLAGPAQADVRICGSEKRHALDLEAQ